MTISFLTPYLSLGLVAVTPPTNDKSKADNHLIVVVFFKLVAITPPTHGKSKSDNHFILFFSS